MFQPTRNPVTLVRIACTIGLAGASFGCFGPTSANVSVTGGFGTIKGSVTVSPDGNVSGTYSLSNTKVRATSATDTQEAAVAADGSFSLPAAAGTTYTVEATNPNGKGEALKGAQTVAVPPKTDQNPPSVNIPSLVLRRTGSVRGLVELVNAKEGDDAVGADVYLAGGTSIVGKSGTRGQFALAGISEGSWNIVVDKPGYKRIMKNLAVKSGQSTDFGTAKLERLLDAPTGLKGLVKDASGAPILGASVSAFPKNRQAAGVENFTAVTNDKGAFELLDLPAGDYQVQVYRTFYVAPARRDVAVKGKEVVDLQTLTMTANLMNFGRIAGRVLDDQGNPVEGALVQTSPPVTDQQFADANGNYVLDRVLPGEYTINASAGGLGLASQFVFLENVQGGANYSLADLIFGAASAATSPTP